MRMLRWLLMLNKRLYKKAAFVVFMVLVPVLAAMLSFAASRESGFMRVVLAQQDKDDPISSEIVSDFLSEGSLILFSYAESPEAALFAIESGQADAAWIFPADMKERIRDHSDGGSSAEPIVLIYEREQTVFTRLSREKLTSAVFVHCAKSHYISYARSNVPGLETLGDEELGGYFDGLFLSREIFSFEGAVSDSDTETSYITAPIRGLLAVLVCLGGAAATMLYMRDEEKGVFSLVKETRRFSVSFACVLIALLNLVAAVLVALFVTGLASGFLRELFGALIYSVCAALFCLLLREILGSIRLYSATLPLLAVVLCAVCPVFFDFGALSAAAHILPPTYYINLLYNSRYLLYMLLYALALAVLILILRLALGRTVLSAGKRGFCQKKS